MRNTEKSHKPGKTDQFQQKIEPAGRYLLHDSIKSGKEGKLSAGWESGSVTFKSPLVLRVNTSDDAIYDDNSWKKRLSAHYGGKVGKKLSEAVVKDGYDGIVTVDKYGTSEIVDLTGVSVSGKKKSVGSSCGANAPGGGGFQPGNTCASEGGGGSDGSYTKPHRDARDLPTDDEFEKYLRDNADQWHLRPDGIDDILHRYRRSSVKDKLRTLDASEFPIKENNEKPETEIKGDKKTEKMRLLPSREDVDRISRDGADGTIKPDDTIFVRHQTTSKWEKEFVEHGIDTRSAPPDSRLGRLTNVDGNLVQSRINAPGLYVEPSQDDHNYGVIIQVQAKDIKPSVESKGLGYETGLDGLYQVKDAVIEGRVIAPEEVVGVYKWDSSANKAVWVPNPRNPNSGMLDVQDGRLALKGHEQKKAFSIKKHYPGGQDHDQGNHAGDGGSATASEGKQSEHVRQWAKSRFGSEETAERFASWFGESKVTDQDKNPMVVYHSTSAKDDFSEFKTDGVGAHFGTLGAADARSSHVEKFAKNHLLREPGPARLMPVYLSIENPLEMPDLAGLYKNMKGELVPKDEVDDRLDEFYQEDRDNPRRPQPMAWENEGDFSTYLRDRNIITSNELWDVMYDKDKAVELLKEKGYDGIVYKNAVEDAGSESYIVFDPEQVKSAVGNDGKFDSGSGDIRKSYQKKSSSCGANAPGGGGFQPGNDCASESGGGKSGGGKSSERVRAWAKDRFGDDSKAENFAVWFGESKAVDDDGDPEETVPIEVYHGTTHDFDEFDLSKTNPESDMGGGFYFSSDRGDSQGNYGSDGPDLTQRIELMAEQIEYDIDAENMTAEDLADQFEITVEQAESVLEEAEGDNREAAKLVATAKLDGGNEKVLSVFLKIEKPVFVGDPKWGKGSRRPASGETFFDVEYSEEDAEGRTPDDDDFDPDTAEFGEPKGKLVDFMEALRSEASDRGYDADDRIEELMQIAMENEGMRAGEILSRVKSLDVFMDSQRDDGRFEGGDIMAAALRRAGFDGLVYMDASEHFPNFGVRSGQPIPEGTRHYVVWDSKQIKSSDENEGTFDPENPSIRKALPARKKSSDCGANGPGGGGFQPGNDCASSGGSSGGGVDRDKFIDFMKHKTSYGDEQVAEVVKNPSKQTMKRFYLESSSRYGSEPLRGFAGRNGDLYVWSDPTFLHDTADYEIGDMVGPYKKVLLWMNKDGAVTGYSGGQVEDEGDGDSLKKLMESHAGYQAVKKSIKGKRKSSDCGANAPGGGGFQTGNSCASGGGGGGATGDGRRRPKFDNPRMREGYNELQEEFHKIPATARAKFFEEYKKGGKARDKAIEIAKENGLDAEKIHAYMKAEDELARNEKERRAYERSGPEYAPDVEGNRSKNPQVQSPEFKQWFGDSKIVNEDGSPRVLFHGTRADFNEFEVSDDGLVNETMGVHVAKDPKLTDAFSVGTYAASSAWSEGEDAVKTRSKDGHRIPDMIKPGGNTKPVFVKMEKPYIMPNYGSMDQHNIRIDVFDKVFREDKNAFIHFATSTRNVSPEEAEDAYERLSRNEPIENGNLSVPQSYIDEYGSGFAGFASNYSPEFAPDYKGKDWKNWAGKRYKEIMVSQGYDGIIYENTSGNEVGHDGKIDHTSYIVFDPKNIKSATGNEGKFNPESADIRKSMRHLLSPSHQRWLRGQMKRFVAQVKASECGANAPGGGGFQPGNTCAGEGGGTATDEMPGFINKETLKKNKSLVEDLFGPDFYEFAIKQKEGTPFLNAWAAFTLKDSVKDKSPRRRMDVTKSPAFKRWFADSKVVNDDGKPLVVYHGSGNLITEFKTDLDLGPERANAAFFSSSPSVSSGYATYETTEEKLLSKQVSDIYADQYNDWMELGYSSLPGEDARVRIANDLLDSGEITRETYDRLGSYDDRMYDLGQTKIKDGTPNLTPVYLSLKNPMVVDANGMSWDFVVEQTLQRVDRSVHDGVIFKNVNDNANDSSELATTYAVFDPENIKSATGNSGDFDRSSRDIKKAMPPMIKSMNIYSHGLLLELQEEIENFVFDTDRSCGGMCDPVVRHCIGHVCDDLSDMLDEINDLTEFVYGNSPKMKSADCGANAPGGGGFQPGNDCASGGGGGRWRLPTSDTELVSLEGAPAEGDQVYLGEEEYRVMRVYSDGKIGVLGRKNGDAKKVEAGDLKKLVDKKKGSGSSKADEIFGKSKPPTVAIGKGFESARAGVLTSLGIPRNTTNEELAKLCGYRDDTTEVMVSHESRPSKLVMSSYGPGYRNIRQLTRDENGDLVLKNVIFTVDEDYQKKGIGAEVFSRQVEQARKMGVKRIETNALRADDEDGKPGGEANGYATWPKFGYDAHINMKDMAGIEDTLKKGLKKNPEYKNVTKISEIMKTPEGREWWTKYGITFDMEFDLSDNSHSMKIFNAYMEAKRKKK
jgi:GNAT superfamily N-acetyltransferase